MVELAALALPVAFGVFGHIYYNLRDVRNRAYGNIDEEKARQLIEDKLKPVEYKTEDIKEDINRLEKKIDYLISKSK